MADEWDVYQDALVLANWIGRMTENGKSPLYAYRLPGDVARAKARIRGEATDAPYNATGGTR